MVGMDKETVNNYVRKAKADPLGIDGLLKLDDPVLERRLKGGNAAYPDRRFERFRELLPRLEDEMARRGKTHVTLKLLWEEYRRENPDGYSLTQFRYHYRQNVLAAKPVRASIVLADLHAGGEKAFLDYAGDTLGYIDMGTGELVRVQTFVACLPASDYGHALCVPSQRTEDFEEITLARVSSSLHRFFDRLAQTDLLILDDFGMKVLDGQQLLDFMEIIEDRHGKKATVIVSQLPVSDWYDILQKNTTAADAILDRLVHTAVRIELKGDSMRRKKTGKENADKEK